MVCEPKIYLEMDSWSFNRPRETVGLPTALDKLINEKKEYLLL